MIGVVYEVGRYRKLLSETVREGDVVVEIGPHLGLSTESYLGKCSKTVLVDKGLDCAGELSELADSEPKVSFVCGDARGFDAVSLVLEHVESCDVLAVDLGGGRYPDTVFKVWGTWSGVLKPRDSIIRSRGIIEFLKRAIVLDDTLPDVFEDSGWLAEYGRGRPYSLRKQLDEFKHWVDINRRISEEE
ncbi:MAG: SAM-dependent methyltransferase [Candidatus Altiarchaeota archaeon]